LDKRLGRAQLEPGNLGELIDLISITGFGVGDKARSVFGDTVMKQAVALSAQWTFG
jgi:type I restriction enzyme M protein